MGDREKDELELNTALLLARHIEEEALATVWAGGVVTEDQIGDLAIAYASVLRVLKEKLPLSELTMFSEQRVCVAA